MPHKTKIKICGLKRMADVEIANRLHPDYVGFVFAGTKRKITQETARMLRGALAPGILPVGVFVNESPENIEAICRAGILELIQLHGDETEGYIAKIKERTGKPVIRAVRVRTVEDILEKVDTCADYLLFDAYRVGEYGGSGETFCWDILLAAKKCQEGKGKTFPPFFLAGGLHAGNAMEAVKRLQPYALDVSSGVETGGVKDAGKIKELLGCIR